MSPRATPQGIGVLDDRDRRAVLGGEFGHQPESGVGVVDVVIGQFLALMLDRRGDARCRSLRQYRKPPP